MHACECSVSDRASKLSKPFSRMSATRGCQPENEEAELLAGRCSATQGCELENNEGKEEEEQAMLARCLQKEHAVHGPEICAVIAQLLLTAGVPLVMTQLVCTLLKCPGVDLTADAYMTEYFAGAREVTKAFLKAGLAAVSYEIKDDPVMQDYCSNIGWLHALHLGLKTKRGACSLSAPVCSSWVKINVGTSGRSKTRPLGNAQYPSVATANRMMSRVVLLCCIFDALGIWWLVEQPMGSLMQWHPRWQWLMSVRAVYRLSFRMRTFGAATDKAGMGDLQVYS